MDIQYEDNTTCLQCWGSRIRPSYHLYTTQIQHEKNQACISQRSVKLSLKKHKQIKESQKSHGSPNYRFSHQQYHQKREGPFSMVQQKYPTHRSGSHRIQHRQHSHVTEEKPLKIIFNHVNYKVFDDSREMAAKLKGVLAKKEGILVDQTTKLVEAYKKNKSEVYQTKKVIPSPRISLQEISNMKQSVYSIFQSEEKAKVQQSIIMMDYFNPTTSRLQQFKLKSQLKLSSCIRQLKQ